MKNQNVKKWALMFFVGLGLILNSGQVKAQNYSANASNGSISVDGTSNVHDWTLKAENFTVRVNIVKENNTPTLKDLSLSLVVESLKSGKSAMDKNTYKALNSSKHKNIVFKQTKLISVKQASAGSYNVVVQGNLTINGVTKAINLAFQLKEIGGGYSLVGSHKINTPQYNVEPVSALLGTVKTGADVEIKYNLKLK